MGHPITRAFRRAAAKRAAAGVTHALLVAGAPPLVLEPGAPVVLGREPTATIRIDAPAVAASHAAIYWEPEGPLLVDTSGRETRVNGAPIEVHALAPGDVLAIGPLRAVYVELPRAGITAGRGAS